MPISNGIALPNALANGQVVDAPKLYADLTTLLTALNAALYAPTPGSGANAGGEQIKNIANASASTDAVAFGQLSAYALTSSLSAYALVSSLSAYAPLASPALTGAPTAPTAALATNNTQLATTAFVTGAVALITAAGSTSFSAVDADSNTHQVLSGATQTLTLGNITAGVGFTKRFTTAWALSCAGGLSKNGAAPGAVTTGNVAANSLITFFHEGAGVWIASGTGLT
jgi:hypothetical protein